MSAREKIQAKCISSSPTLCRLIICEFALAAFLENLQHATYVSVSDDSSEMKVRPDWLGSMQPVNDADRQRLSQEVGALTGSSALTISIDAEKQDRQLTSRK